MFNKSPFSGFREDKRKQRKRIRLALVLLSVVLVIYVIRGPLFTGLGGFFHVVGRPVWIVADLLGEKFSGLSHWVVSKKELTVENARLKAALDLLSAEAHTRELLRAENEQLKAKLGRNPESALLLARVLRTPGASAYDTLVIDAGEEHGAHIGMKVFGDGEFVIGEVSRVFNRSAVVELYSSHGYELSVTVGTSSIPATAEGLGGGTFRVTLPRGALVEVGDIVDVPSLSPQFAGVVDAVNLPEGSSLQYVYFKWPLNIYELKWVYLQYEE